MKSPPLSPTTATGIILFAMAACFMAGQAKAMTLHDVLAAGNNLNDSSILRAITPVVEPLSRWNAAAVDSPASREPVKRLLYGAIDALNIRLPQKDRPETVLLKGLLWHYLYRLDVDSAFLKSDSLANHVMKIRPEIAEAAWLKGINLIRGGRLQQGFIILDSLRNCDRIKNQDFLVDYTKLSAQCFLPLRQSRSDSLAFFLPSAAGDGRSTLNEEEIVPFSMTWRVYSQDTPKAEMPELTFSGTYALYQPLSLMFTPFNPAPRSRLEVTIDNRLYSPVTAPLRYDPELLKYRMEITITVDCNRPFRPLSDYVRSVVVFNSFDAIRQTDELPKLHAISLRCYNRSPFQNVSGDFCAIVAFDLNKGCFHRFGNRTTAIKSELPTRYLVVMKTTQAVETKAEMIFRDLLRQFACF